MNISALRQTNYRTDYAGYKATGDAKTDAFYNGLSSATEKSTTKREGDILGLTMLPYSDSMSYGMAAYYSEASTEEYPVIQISSNYGGEQRLYDDVDPRNATQLEMFALACYLDDQGITNGGTFGSYSRMQAYATNAAYLEYGIDLQDPANASAKIDWISMLTQMAQIYLQNTQAYSQYLDCNSLVSTFEGWSEGNIGKEHIDYQKILQEKISEISAKIRNGDTEQTYQIGGQAFSEKEWEELLEKFDSVQDAIGELMREEQEQREAERLKENTVTQEESTMLVSESTMCSYPTNNPDDEIIQYITWYTEEGIFCRNAGQTDGYEWIVPFESKEQYDKVMGFIDKFPSDWNFRFAAHENFWKDYLNGTIDEKAFMDFMEGTDNGVPDYSLVRGDSVYVDKDKIKWAEYLNPLGGRFYTAEEFHKQQMEFIAANAAKLPKITDSYAEIV